MAERLARTGFARLGVVLDPEQVGAARAVFDEAMARLDQPVGNAWFPTIMLPDDEVRSFVADSLRVILGPVLSDVLDEDELDLLELHFSVKPPSPGSELGPHQDFSVVDERRATSLYVWVALEDMDEHNGALHVVPGSHRFANSVRSQHVPATFDEVLPQVHDAAERLDCRAGELVVMVSGVIHFSPPNRSDHVRLAAHGIVVPVGEPMVFYFADDSTPAGRVECYELDLDTYVRQVRIGRPGDGSVPVELVDRPPPMDPARFEAGLASVRDAVA
ncbi:MAG: phytanoyl-CoA dioxygenase family protein [Microthrixaceae bacterium]